MFLLADYLYWQFVIGPAWLVQFVLTLHGVLWRLFSVPVMVRTLVAHWRKDAVGYRQGSLGGMAQALAWNMISRGIGFLIRSLVLLGWVVAELGLVVGGVFVVVLFVLWPIWGAALAVVGVALLTV